MTGPHMSFLRESILSEERTTYWLTRIWGSIFFIFMLYTWGHMIWFMTTPREAWTHFIYLIPGSFMFYSLWCWSKAETRHNDAEAAWDCFVEQRIADTNEGLWKREDAR